MSRVLVTGANGFVGQRLCRELRSNGHHVRAAVRKKAPSFCEAGTDTVLVGDIAGDIDWSMALANIDCIVHLAARVHVMKERGDDPLSEYRKVNVGATLKLARQAVRAGVKRFLFLSSIKVNGEQTCPGRPFREEDEPVPVDPYGISKHEAENELRSLARATGLEVVILRPVLVYGPGVKGNFLSMMRWLYRGVPLPLGALRNRRSLLAIDNLVDLIETCIVHPEAANQVFLVADGVDYSTTELARRLAEALGVPARLIAVPEKILLAGCFLPGLKSMVTRLTGSLQVDISRARNQLGWSPPVKPEQTFRQTAAHFLRTIDSCM